MGRRVVGRRRCSRRRASARGTTTPRIEALDVNGDGKVDVVRRWSEGPEQHAQVWLSDGSRAFDEGWSGVTGATCVATR